MSVSREEEVSSGGSDEKKEHINTNTVVRNLVWWRVQSRSL